MKKVIACVVVALAIVVGALALGGDGADAQRRGQVEPIVGWVYPVTSLEDWAKSEVTFTGQAKGGATGRTYMLRTHFPYQRGHNDAQTRLNMQFAMHRAMDAGWQATGTVSGDSIMLYHAAPGDLHRLSDNPPR
jgi:hypothetical protein